MSKSSDLPLASVILPVVAEIVNKPSLFPFVIEYAMALLSLSLSLVVSLSWRSVISKPGLMLSKTSTTSSATIGALSLMLVTLTVIVALSVFVPSDARTVSV